ncbi:HNH endonuclease [Halorubrum sp. SY-15]|uniref:HNH endonuclease n=1 Tax=Halorubrum sp. SY-15 TaxID=3402277 RepID=UPI003EBBFCA9
MPTDDYPSDWNSRRKIVYQRDGHECQNCGRHGGSKGDAELHAHHVVPKSQGGTHDTTNLITICKECHKAVHSDQKAPTKQSRDSTDSRRIRDIDSITSTMGQLQEQKETVSGLITIPTGDFDDWPDYEIAQRGGQFISIAKEAREGLTDCRFKLKNIDYESLDISEKVQSKDEAQNKLENMAIVMLEQTDLLLQGSNISQEYIENIDGTICTNCGNKESFEDSFCGQCGESLPDVWSCQNCGKKFEKVTQDFCKSCGNQITIVFSEKQDSHLESLRKKANKIVEKVDDSNQEFADLTRQLEEIVY